MRQRRVIPAGKLFTGDKIGMHIERKVQLKKFEPVTVGFWGETTVKESEDGDKAVLRLEQFLDRQLSRKLKPIIK